jgi:Kef-type K+ transport system membrane component KefB
MNDWFLVLFGSGWILCFLSIILIYLFKRDGVSNVSIFMKGSSVFGDLDKIVNPNKLKYIKILSLIGVIFIILSLVVLWASKS